jgi:short-subunit dehydrogenase
MLDLRRGSPMTYKTALITGASSGIGRNLSLRLARDGTHVVVCARRTAELHSLAAEIVHQGGSAHVLTLDITDADWTVAQIRKTDEELGGLDLIVANAGLGGPLHASKITWEKIAPMIRLNFVGAIATLTAVLPRMLLRGRGHLVGVSSVMAITPWPQGAPYCSTKTGLSTFLESLRLDLEGTGVRVTTVQPGVVKTPMSDRVKGTLPFVVSCQEAVDLIVERLPPGPRMIEFPFVLTSAMHLLANLPRPLRHAALHRIPIPEVEE